MSKEALKDYFGLAMAILILTVAFWRYIPGIIEGILIFAGFILLFYLWGYIVYIVFVKKHTTVR